MYAAIFSPSQYECNLNRILNRLNNQVDIFTAKADILSGRGCTEINGLRQELAGLKGAINLALNTKDYSAIKVYRSNIESKNMIDCPLY